MSTIIDALKRSDRERQINTTHTMSYSHLNAEHKQTKTWIKYSIITLLVSAVGIFLIASWFDREQPDTSVIQTTENTSAIIEATPIKAKEPVSIVTKTPAPIVEETIPEISKPVVSQKPNSALASLIKPVAESANNEIDEARTSLSKLVSVPAPAPAPEPQAEVVDTVIATEANAGLTETQSQPAQKKTVILVDDFTDYENYASIRVSQNLPELHLDILMYHNDSSQRKAFINMQAYKQGEQISEGAEIVEIGEKGVLLRYQGTDFVLRAN